MYLSLSLSKLFITPILKSNDIGEPPQSTAGEPVAEVSVPNSDNENYKVIVI